MLAPLIVAIRRVILIIDAVAVHPRRFPILSLGVNLGPRWQTRERDRLHFQIAVPRVPFQKPLDFADHLCLADGEPICIHIRRFKRLTRLRLRYANCM